ncbi:MAG TPA: hypothetical protein VFY13_07995 [Luteolibacter sp.]|nr:hypothetical protein [Luteolibacter sp.]
MSSLRPAVRVRYAHALAGALAAAGLVVWFQQRAGEVDSVRSTGGLLVGLNLEDPEPSYLILRHAVETGGTERTRELAVTWLDRQTRRQLPLTAEQENWFLAKLAANGHASWDSEFRFLFFNSAFNVLHLGSQQEELARLLVKLAVEAPEKTMRLYALQHIGVQRNIGHLTGPMADEVRATLHTLAAQPGSPVAGTALSNLTLWEGPETAPGQALIDLALKLAEEPTCEVDVRVTALHTAGAASLPLARRLAPDTKQPVQLRKAAIARIGQHGEAADCASLESLIAENFRIAQAAEPALRSLQQRSSNPQAPAPIRF